ncbi:MAG TPA: M50 family metallopeptidase [bacterium]|nr:M50 family metallopeptidase [bacterium]
MRQSDRMALLGLVLRFIAALGLWPLAGGLTAALGRLLWHLPWSQGGLPWFAGGFVAYLVVQIFFWRPLFLYVMGHELTHALAAVLQGGNADDLHVSTKGGRVRVNRSNFMVDLAPYFFPLYTVGACLVWAVAAERFKPLISSLIGFTLAFHFALTLFSLKQHQSDIAEGGWFFSIPLILALNVLICVLVLRLLAPGPVSLGAFFLDAWSTLRAGAHWVRLRV